MKTCFLLAGLFCAALTQAQPASYWQQRVDTRLSVTLDDHHHFLRGHITLDYYNQSPDTLTYIYFHLYPNAYSSDRSAYTRQAVENGNTDFYFSKREQGGYIDSLEFSRLVTVQTEERIRLGVVETEHPDVVKVMLDQPLLPATHIVISTPFRVKIPSVFSRMGHSGQAYYISQWFPKPAVYDGEGWHPYPYLDQGEFYSEYGSYEVSVSLPENYILMATGNILEPEECQWLDSLAALPLPADTLYKTYTPESSAAYKTVTFTEDNVHDFAWFADKRWVVRKEVFAVPGTHDRVSAYTCFSPQHQKAWNGGIGALKTTVESLSRWVGPYPYKTIKAVEGLLVAGSAMEYPTITLVGGSDDPEYIHTCVVHEAGHNWFYGIIGSNERRYPWMDESINSFYEHRIAPDTGRGSKALGGLSLNYLSYAMMAAKHTLMPVSSASDSFPYINYATDIYGKGAFYFEWLSAYMGPEHFQSAMQAYYETWKFRHPQPRDFEALFRKHSDKSLDWFFDELLPSDRPVDFAIGKVRRDATGTYVQVKNKSGLKLPVQVQLDDGSSASAWSEPFTGTAELHLAEQEGQVVINPDIADYNRNNNSEYMPLRIRPFAGMNMHTGYKTWLLPALGYNVYDRFMLGMVVHNLSVPKNKFQYALAPMYTFGSQTFAGTGFLSYEFFHQESWLHTTELRLEGKTFAYDRNNLNIDHYKYKRFFKLAPEIVWTLKPPFARSAVHRSLSLTGFWINEGQLSFRQDAVDSLYRPETAPDVTQLYARLRYRHEHNRTLNPFDYTFEGQFGRQFAKLSLTANLRIDYHMKNKGLHVRAFAGKFFNLAAQPYDSYRYRLASTFNGYNDYLYEDTYLGRSETMGFPAQQISLREGGFKINTLQYANQIGLSDDWLFTLNLKTDLPLGWLPVRLFADLGTSGAAPVPEGARIYYAAGVELFLGSYFSLYVPVVMSKEYSDYQKSVFPKDRFWHSISFALHLDRIAWTNLGDKLLQF